MGLAPLLLLCALLQCKACEDTGVVACRACKRDSCTGSVSALFCSAAAACKECAGLRVADCARCERADAASLDARRAELAAWLTEMRAVDAFMEKPLFHAESSHFRLTYDLKRIDVKGGGDFHGGIHVYLDRLEEFHADFARDLGASEEHWLGKTWVLIWGREQDQAKASLQYTGQGSTTASKLMGAKPVLSIFYDKSHLHEEFELHQAVVHHVAHCLLSNVFDGIWPGNIGGGWIDDGLAHWYETAYFGGVRHYCYVESDTMLDFKFGSWEPAVLSAVGRGEHLPFLRVTGRNTAELSPEEHMYAWSFVDYCLRAQPGKLGSLARALKQKRPLVDALREVCGMTPYEYESAWRDFVLASYSARPSDKPLRAR
jgi:hypothetical protein